jgi:hypothetical protein
MSKRLDLEGLHYTILQEYLETGDKKIIESPEMVEYLEQLDLVRGWHYSLYTESKIIRALQLKYTSMSYDVARRRYTDAINYFYCDTAIKKEAYRNLAADELYKAYTAAIMSAREPKDYKIAADILFKSLEARGAMDDDPEELPDHIFENRTPVFVLDPGALKLPKADRNVLANQIDNMPITELKKQKLKQHAGIESLELFDDDDDA